MNPKIKPPEPACSHCKGKGWFYSQSKWPVLCKCVGQQPNTTKRKR